MLLASGPQIKRGALQSESFYRTTSGPQGEVQVVETRDRTHPTLLDIIPTALVWLGYGEEALSRFSRNGFESHLAEWTSRQKSELLVQLGSVTDLQRALTEVGLDGFDTDRFRNRLRRLLQFVPERPPDLPDYRDYREDGNLLLLRPD